MTDTTIGAKAPGIFRVGAVLSQAATILSRNFLTFFILTVIPTLPNLLFLGGAGLRGAEGRAPGSAGLLVGIGVLLAIVLSVISQAVVLYAAFQSMRGRPVQAMESVQKGLTRVIPIIGVAICMMIAIGIGFLLLVIPGLIAFAMFFVALPVCVVERLGPIRSLSRSAQLTKGHRWRLLGLFILLMLISAIVGGVLQVALEFIGGFVVTVIGSLVWNAAFGAYSSIVFVVAYHDLRVAKEGVDIERIAAVFD